MNVLQSGMKCGGWYVKTEENVIVGHIHLYLVLVSNEQDAYGFKI